MKDYVSLYYKNNRLKTIVDRIIIQHFGWISQKDYDDFYSIAGETLWLCQQKYDETKGAQFETYLINCLLKKFKTRITYMNRRRRNDCETISLDLLVENGDAHILGLVAITDEHDNDTYSDKMINYLNKLSTIQKKILFALADGYLPDEIKRQFKLTDTEYCDACNAIKSYRNVSVLY